MYINITASESGDNKGSSGALVNYLEKENHLQPEKGLALIQENWFNGTGQEIGRQEVRMKIDRNVAKLCRDDSKFFLININPSQKELAHLLARYGEQGAKLKLKDFGLKVMDEYARNFKRAGIDSHKDLLWFGKLENYRYYSFKDKEVKEGTKQAGDRKAGCQMHLQIIVSRKDISNQIKLSPQNTSRGKNKEHSAKLGQFDRTAFKQSGESLFDDVFEFDRGLKDTLTYANTMKNGTAIQKMQMQTLGGLPPQEAETGRVILDLSKDVADGLFQSFGDLLVAGTKAGAGLLSLLLSDVYVSNQADPVDDGMLRRKKRKSKSKGQGMGHSR